MKLKHNQSGEIAEAKVLGPEDGVQEYLSGLGLYEIMTDLGREYFRPGDYLLNIGSDRSVCAKETVEKNWSEVVDA